MEIDLSESRSGGAAGMALFDHLPVRIGTQQLLDDGSVTVAHDDKDALVGIPCGAADVRVHPDVAQVPLAEELSTGIVARHPISRSKSMRLRIAVAVTASNSNPFEADKE